MQVEKANHGVIDSPFSVDLHFPAVDIASYIFSSGNASSKKSPQFFDAAEPRRNISLEGAEILVKRVAKGLKGLGLRPDDKVLLCSDNQFYLPVALWGIIAAGCVFTGISPSATVSEFTYQLRDSQAKIVLAAPAQVNVALKAATASGLTSDRVFVLGDPTMPAVTTPSPVAPIKSWTSFWASAELARNWKWDTISTKEEAQAKTAVINYSSGTTGLPKGVELSHYNLVSNVEQLIFKRGRVANSESGRGRARRLEEAGERWLAPLPMYHAFGQIYYSMLAPRVGAKVFVMSKFDLTQYLTYIDIYQVTFINVVPMILLMLTKLPNPERFNLKSLQMVGSGSSPLDIEVARKVEKLFLRPGVQVKQGWGMTETTCNVTGFSPDDPDDGRSIGWVNPGNRIKIVPIPDRDFTNVEKEVGSLVGEIWVAGPNIMKGYWQKHQETADTIVNEDGNRWLRTGDVGYADSRGCIYIVDRVKELIKVKGLQVSPTELAKALTSHPGVLDAVVVGAKIDGKEMPRAFVVKRDPAVTAEELASLIKSQFAPHKWLTGGVYFLNALPRTASGKVVKRALPDPENKTRSKL